MSYGWTMSDEPCQGHTADEYADAVTFWLAEGDAIKARLSLALLAYHYPGDRRVALGVLQSQVAAAGG